jgi:DNA-binding MarR family transcriptional regulator
MSVQAIALSLKAQGLKPSEKLLLLALANYADDAMKCWPSHKTLAADTGLTQRTILTTFKRLEAAGLLARKPRPRADGSRASDIITLKLGGETIAPRGEMVAPPVGKPLRGGGEMVSPLTTFEPSTEPSKVLLSAEPSARRTKAKPTGAEVEAIWSIAPRQARERSSRADVETALAAAVGRGHALPDIIAGLRAAYASGSYQGDKAKGIHRLIQNDRWASFAEEKGVPAAWDDARWSAVVALNREEGWWTADLGPPPGQPGCRVPSHLIERQAA